MAEKSVSPLFLKLFLPLVALLVGGVLMFGRAEIDSEIVRLQSQENLNVGLGAGALTGQIKSISRDLAYLSTHIALRQAINAPTPDNLTTLAEDFANFSRSKGIYDQLRWIDETGMEIVRVDKLKGQPVVVAADKLQNKGSRYFFTDAFKLQPGEVFISPLDLNIEQNKVEVPYKPMVRLATPVVDDQGKKRGIVILNYDGREMLQDFVTLTTGAADHIMVLNGEGYWLKSPKHNDEWGFMFKRPELSLAARAPEAWKKIRAEDRGQQRLADGLWTWQTVYPLIAGQKSSTGAADAFVHSEGKLEAKQYVWKSVAHLSTEVLDAVSRGVWIPLAGTGVLLLALFGLGCWKLAVTQAQMRELAYSDMLTDLPNRSSLRASLEIALDAWKMKKTPFAVVMMDLDEFKPVNDTYGHDAGDEVLRVVGARLMKVSRPMDMAARLGGDEFIIVINDCPDAGTATEIAQRYIDAISQPIRLRGTDITVKVGASAGVAHLAMGEANVDVVMKNADSALYLAKSDGKNRVVKFQP